MSFWSSAAPYYVLNALGDRYLMDAADRDLELERYMRYRDGRPSAILQYFLQRPRETMPRYLDRPKLSWPFCRLFIDAHADACMRGVASSIDDKPTQKWWEEVEEHNNLPAFMRKVAQTFGTYGACYVRPVIHRERDKAFVEFDSFTNLECKPLFESTGVGRSVKRFIGVAIQTGYNLVNGDIIPMAEIPKELVARERSRVAVRTEFITNTRWLVWLNQELAPVSPFGQVWMPDPNGNNPYGDTLMVLFNGAETEESWEGNSDIVTAVYTNQVANELYSDLIYAHRLSVPYRTLSTEDTNVRGEFNAGLGLGLVMGKNDEFNIHNPQLVLEDYARPLEITLELLYSDAKLPAIAVGMGRTFGGSLDVSGVAKGYEWKPTIAYAESKRPNIVRGIRGLVRSAAIMATTDKRVLVENKLYKLGAGVAGINPDATVSVSFGRDIIPMSQMEQLERLKGEMLAQATARVTAMAEYHGWSPERVWLEVDRIAADAKNAMTGLGAKETEEAVQAKQKAPIDADAAMEAIFAPPPALESDKQFGDGDQGP